MRIRSTGPKVSNILVPSGSTSSPVRYTASASVPWADGSSGLLFGVPYTMGNELQKLNNWTVGPRTPEFAEALWKAVMALAAKASMPFPTVEARVSSEYEEYRDVVTPNFKARIAAGEIINNPMTQIYSSYNADPKPITTLTHNLRGAGDWSWESWHGNGETTVAVVITVNPIWTATSTVFSLTLHEEIVKDLLGRVSSPVDTAVIGAFEKLQAADLDIALMVAEGGETLKYLQQLVMRAAKLMRAITDPKTVFRYAPKAFASISKVGMAKALANAWLEARYALRPLLIDIDDTIQYLSAGKMAKGHDRYTYRKREASQQGGHTTVVVGSQRISVDYSVEKSARAGVLAVAGFDVPGSKFGFMNWAGLTFEKVKFSFILAWLVDLGGLLYRLNPNIKLRPVASWTTEVSSVSYVASMEVDTPTGKQTVTSSGSYRLKSRNPISDNSPPLATIAINLDSFKLLDLLAIVGQIKVR